MNTIVVDCCAVAPWFFPEQDANEALALYADFRKRRVACVAPSLLPIELTNVAWKKVARHLCDPVHATRQIQRFFRCGIYLVDFRPLLLAALDFAMSNSITVYDALYVVVAQAMHAGLATLDARLGNAAKSAGVALWHSS